MVTRATDLRSDPSDGYVVAEVAIRGSPLPRLTRDGYTQRSGSPTAYVVRLAFEDRWRRVYCIQYSNAGSLFIRVNGARVFLSLFTLDNGVIVA
jgi:hypothetical protein